MVLPAWGCQAKTGLQESVLFPLAQCTRTSPDEAGLAILAYGQLSRSWILPAENRECL